VDHEPETAEQTEARAGRYASAASAEPTAQDYAARLEVRAAFRQNELDLHRSRYPWLRSSASEEQAYLAMRATDEAAKAIFLAAQYTACCGCGAVIWHDEVKAAEDEVGAGRGIEGGGLMEAAVQTAGGDAADHGAEVGEPTAAETEAAGDEPGADEGGFVDATGPAAEDDAGAARGAEEGRFTETAEGKEGEVKPDDAGLFKEEQGSSVEDQQGVVLKTEAEEE